MTSIIMLLMFPIALLNMFGVIVSGIWLAVLGEWGGIGWGVAALMCGTFICGFLLMPGLIIAAPAIFLFNKGPILKTLGFLIGLISLSWAFIIICGWGMFSFDFFLSMADIDSEIPYIIWAYSVATAPWAYMAQNEDNLNSHISVFFLQVSCAFSVLSLVFFDLDMNTNTIIFISIMSAGYVLSIISGGVMLVLDIKSKETFIDTY
jgi:hypothetical protein